MIGESANRWISGSAVQQYSRTAHNLSRRIAVMPTSRHAGFTLIELIIVMGILAVLFTIGSIGFFRTQGATYLTEAVDTLVADMNTQQTKAMAGASADGTLIPGYGVHFETTTYTLFTGTSYSAGAATNIVIPLPDNVDVMVAGFTNRTLVYARASGEVSGYVTNQDYVDLRSTVTGETKRIRVNALGVVVEGI